LILELSNAGLGKPACCLVAHDIMPRWRDDRSNEKKITIHSAISKNGETAKNSNNNAFCFFIAAILLGTIASSQEATSQGRGFSEKNTPDCWKNSRCWNDLSIEAEEKKFLFEGWLCRPFFDDNEIYLTALRQRETSLEGTGKISLDNIIRETLYSIDGLDRRWDFDEDENGYNYSVIILPDRSGAYLDFSCGEEKACSSSLLTCQPISHQETKPEQTTKSQPHGTGFSHFHIKSDCRLNVQRSLLRDQVYDNLTPSEKVIYKRNAIDKCVSDVISHESNQIK
jgi:hypothetical protein